MFHRFRDRMPEIRRFPFYHRKRRREGTHVWYKKGDTLGGQEVHRCRTELPRLLHVRQRTYSAKRAGGKRDVLQRCVSGASGAIGANRLLLYGLFDYFAVPEA